MTTTWPASVRNRQSSAQPSGTKYSVALRRIRRSRNGRAPARPFLLPTPYSLVRSVTGLHSSLGLVEEISPACVIPELVFIHPVIRPERNSLRPDLIERHRVVQRSTLHHVLHVQRVLDVRERVRVEHHQVREFAHFELAEVVVRGEKVGVVVA